MLANAMIAAATTGDFSEYEEYINFFQQNIPRVFRFNFILFQVTACLLIYRSHLSDSNNKNRDNL